MKRLEVSGAVRPVYGSLGVERLIIGTAVAQCLRCCATNRMVAGSIPDGVIGIFRWHNPFDRMWPWGRLSL